MSEAGANRLAWAPRRRRIRSAGCWLVPADIRHIEATLIFDARRQTATGRATVRFQALEDGWPFFDLRQEVAGALLDGTPLPAEAIAPLQVGPLAEQSVRPIRRSTEAGAESVLELEYPLTLPRASAKGTYRPGILWLQQPQGGGVNFNFGFTDLGGGRYLESWIPANLVFDEVQLTLEVAVVGTAAPHVLVTNGTAVPLDANRWRVEFPARFHTALSPLLQLHPAAALESGSCQARLPASGHEIAIEVHKFIGDPVDLAAQLDNIARWLGRNELQFGPYVHGGRYTAFLHIGGMEYDGACTSSADALEHEVFHSWWARGLKPASQNDGWIDEALAVYFDHGGDTAVPFDFSEPAVTLCSTNRWNRATPIEAYRQGFRFVQGLAACLGADHLRALLREYYCAHAPGLVTTADLERFLVSRSGGDKEMQRAFSRFVYGRE